MAQLKDTTIDGSLIVNGSITSPVIDGLHSAKTNGILTSGTDLNTLITYNDTGFYAVTGDRTYLNLPDGVTWGFLKVIMISDDSWVLQEFFSDGRFHVRIYANSTWSNWVEH